MYWRASVTASVVELFCCKRCRCSKKGCCANATKVLFEPHSIPARGWDAVFSDPQRVIFAVLASSSGDTPDVLAAPGEWIWSSLITSEPDTVSYTHLTL